MNNLQRVGDGTVQIWRALPTWAKVITAIVGGVVVYYAFGILFLLLIAAAFGIGIVTLVRWFIRR
jgi:hypothetical protein